jgi:3-hydroxybutyryl-CoA dehydrogenase
MKLEDIKQVSILGCGLMGTGIAQICAQHGYEVYVRDLTDDILAKGLNSIKESIQKHLVDKGKIERKKADDIISKIKSTTNMAVAVKNADIIIEAVPENIELKRKVFSEAEKSSPKHTIFASNTSSLMIKEISTAVNRKDRLIGMHWFYPPQVMKLIEVVKGIQTSDETYKLICDFSIDLEKVPVTSKDSPGFVVVRLISAFLAEAIRCVEEDIMTVEDIDKACKLGLNHPMGPFELLDFTGLDTYLEVYDYIYKTTGYPRFRPTSLLRKMVSSECLGRKTGKGFYNYNKK